MRFHRPAFERSRSARASPSACSAISSGPHTGHVVPRGHVQCDGSSRIRARASRTVALASVSDWRRPRLMMGFMRPPNPCASPRNRRRNQTIRLTRRNPTGTRGDSPRIGIHGTRHNPRPRGAWLDTRNMRQCVARSSSEPFRIESFELGRRELVRYREGLV